MKSITAKILTMTLICLIVIIAIIFVPVASADHFAGPYTPCGFEPDFAQRCFYKSPGTLELFVCQKNESGDSVWTLFWDDWGSSLILCSQDEDCVENEPGHAFCTKRQQQGEENIFKKISNIMKEGFTSPETADSRRPGDGNSIILKLKAADLQAPKTSACPELMELVQQNTFVTGGKVTGPELEQMIKFGLIVFNKLGQGILKSLQSLFDDTTACYNHETWAMALVDSAGDVLRSNTELGSDFREAAQEAKRLGEQQRAAAESRVGAGHESIMVDLKLVEGSERAEEEETKETTEGKKGEPIILALAMEEAEPESAQPAQLPVLFAASLGKIEIPPKVVKLEFEFFAEAVGKLLKLIWKCPNGSCEINGFNVSMVVSGNGSSIQVAPEQSGPYTYTMTDGSNGESYPVTIVVATQNGVPVPTVVAPLTPATETAPPTPTTQKVLPAR